MIRERYDIDDREPDEIYEIELTITVDEYQIESDGDGDWLEARVFEASCFGAEAIGIGEQEITQTILLNIQHHVKKELRQLVKDRNDS